MPESEVGLVDGGLSPAAMRGQSAVRQAFVASLHGSTLSGAPPHPRSAVLLLGAALHAFAVPGALFWCRLAVVGAPRTVAAVSLVVVLPLPGRGRRWGVCGTGDRRLVNLKISLAG